MRRPSDIPPPAPRAPGRRRRRVRIWLIVAAIVLIVLLASLKTLATFYTDYLWFASVNQSAVWRGMLGVKLGLFLVFAAVFFVVLWVNLAVVDRMTPSMLTLGPEDELVRRYQQLVIPRAFLVRTIVSVVIALIAASSTVGEWQNWMLYIHGVPFGVKDPLFHRDVGWFVFKLPFIEFVISWVFASLVVITIITAVAHYLNGGIRPQGRPPRVAPQVKVHLSIMVAVIAIVKAVGYYYQRFTLDLSSNGYVQGAGYTDVHARLPALTLLFWISLLAAVILLVNIRGRGWLLPLLAVGLWAFVAVVVGAIYPAVVQALKVSPAQSTLELPYIQRNINATQAAYNLTSSNVDQQPYAATQSLTPAEEKSDAATFNDIRLWDPSQALTGPTYTKLQQERSYYQFTTQALDRYMIDGALTPAVVAVRQVNSNNLPAQGWVNTHLQYTHGYGMIVSPANTATSNGQPQFAVQNVPPVSTNPSLDIAQPNVYFGVNEPGYVIADTKQKEIDYQLPNGANQESNYGGTGGVKLNSFFKRAAFAIRFGDLNVLISDLITSNSRMMFVRDIQTEVQKAAPFLSLDSDPYAVLMNGKTGGEVDWVQDAYTTTGNYPYSQNADTGAVSSSSGLAGQTFNYVRNSVKVVINAYTGQMTFYVMDPFDPIIRTWMKTFPSLFTPATQMPLDLQSHLRYPEDIFTVQTAMYGKYHIDTAAAFYNAGDAWSLSQNPGAGSPTAALQSTFTTNSQGQTVQGQIQRMAPIYQVLQIPGESSPTFNIMEAYVPVSQNDSVQTLAAFVFGNCNYGPDYGQFTVFETPAGETFDGPALIDARILQNTTVSKAITLLNQGGSSVVLGNLLIVPVDGNILYFRPLYLEGRNALPVLTDVIAVYGGQGNSQVYMESTLTQALTDIFGTTVSLPSQKNTGTGKKPTTGPPVTSQERVLIARANALSKQAQTALSHEDLGAYEADVKQLITVVQQLAALAAKSNTKPPAKTPPTTTTTKPPTTSTTTATTSTSTSSTSTSTTAAVTNAGTRASPSTTSTTGSA